KRKELKPIYLILTIIYLNFKKKFEQPLHFKILQKVFRIDDIPELHDRIIAGSALELDSFLLTNDPVIQKFKFIDAIWD
ncbi:MAG: hypothetical protein ACHQK8_06215, partial [Bacteroidia bacterium]